eukprot:jgi/Picre1/34838/NNA_002304.t1
MWVRCMGLGRLGLVADDFSPARQGDFAGSFNIGSYHGHGHMMHHRRRAAVGTLDDDHNGDRRRRGHAENARAIAFDSGE